MEVASEELHDGKIVKKLVENLSKVKLSQ